MLNFSDVTGCPIVYAKHLWMCFVAFDVGPEIRDKLETMVVPLRLKDLDCTSRPVVHFLRILVIYMTQATQQLLLRMLALGTSKRVPNVFENDSGMFVNGRELSSLINEVMVSWAGPMGGEVLCL